MTLKIEHIAFTVCRDCDQWITDPGDGRFKNCLCAKYATQSTSGFSPENLLICATEQLTASENKIKTLRGHIQKRIDVTNSLPEQQLAYKRVLEWLEENDA